MTPDQFRELCRDASRVLGLADAEALFESRDTVLDGVKVGSFHDEAADPDGVFCYVDLGPIGPDARPVELMEEILALNLSLDGAMGEVIGMERESRHLVLRARLSEQQGSLDAHELAECLRHYAAVANDLFERVLFGVERAG
jgi:hypothetical protein